MCNDQELFVAYVYDELAPEHRVAFDAHLRSCSDCRHEVEGLRSTRGYLAAWAPPQPDLGFQIVRHAVESRGKVMPFRARWMPAFGLAAAAVLLLAVASAIANLEVRYDDAGLVVRTGWAKSAPPVQPPDQHNEAQPVAANAGAVAADFAAVEQRLRALEASLAVQPVHAAARTSDADMLRQVRAIVREAEMRQEGAVAQRLLQVWQDFDKVRRADMAMLQQGTAQYQGVTNAELVRLGQELRVKHLEK